MPGEEPGTQPESGRPMPRVASAALALLLAFAASPLAAAQPVAAAVVPPLPADAGAVEPSAKADPTNRWIVVYNDDTDLKAANGRARGRGISASRDLGSGTPGRRWPQPPSAERQGRSADRRMRGSARPNASMCSNLPSSRCARHCGW